MNNLEEIIIKYKLNYNKDKTYFKFNFQYDYNETYFSFKRYLKQSNQNIKLINIVNIAKKIKIDSDDFVPIYNFMKSQRNIIYYLDDRDLINDLANVSLGCDFVPFYNLPIFIICNGKPIFSDFSIFDESSFNRFLNYFSGDKKCNICYEDYLTGHYCKVCFYKICLKCYENLNSNNYNLQHSTCPFCRTQQF